MNNKVFFKKHADFCKFMGSSKRLEILSLLKDEELCVDDLAKKMGVPIANISQHLAVMRDKGIVEVRRSGVKMFYKISDIRIVDVCSLMSKIMLDHLKKELDSFSED